MSLRKETKFTIEGHDYHLTQLGGLKGRKIWLKLWKLLAAPLKELSSSATLTEQTFAGALAAALEDLDESVLEELYVVFGESCEVREGERWPKLDGTVFDVHFAGRYIAMSMWLWKCVEFNFLDFLGGISLGAMLAKAKTKVIAATAASPSPTESTGSSGES